MSTDNNVSSNKPKIEKKTSVTITEEKRGKHRKQKKYEKQQEQLWESGGIKDGKKEASKKSESNRDIATKAVSGFFV